ncbi:phosphate ABC transporter, permease protein PstC [Lactobacillus jensenii 115-3-CHN]|nr:phosphate ABC transporter, permease protein PstC [Lactobacillus jensenii 115-3-CHN]
MMKQNKKHLLLSPSKESYEEKWGKTISYGSIALIGIVVISIIIFLTGKGLALFLKDHASIWEFLTSNNWNPSHNSFGALPMIVTSFVVTLLAGIIAAPFALIIALAINEIFPKWFGKILQPIIELLVGVPSVVYGFAGLILITPVLRGFFGGSGFGILAAVVVLFMMILPTMVSMMVDSLRATPKNFRTASYDLGATRWQTLHMVVIPSAKGGLLTAIIFGMTRAFGEALAVQMVIGNAALMPKNLMSPAATLTSVLTTGMGNTIMGTSANDALWSLALVLLLMSLVFNILIKLINKKRG